MSKTKLKPKTVVVTERSWYPSAMGPMVAYSVDGGPEYGYGLPLYSLFDGLGDDLRKQRKYRITVEVIEEGPTLGENSWHKNRSAK